MSSNPQPPYPPRQPPPPLPPQPPYPQQPYAQQPPYPQQQPYPQTLEYGHVCCPRCGCPNFSKVSFTWWGGFLGPKLLNHVRCQGCGYQFNGKTGQSNGSGIAIYTIVGLALGVIIFALLWYNDVWG